MYYSHHHRGTSAHHHHKGHGHGHHGHVPNGDSSYADKKKALARSKSQIPYSSSDPCYRLSNGGGGEDVPNSAAAAAAAAAVAAIVPPPSPPQAPTLPPGVAGANANAANKQPLRKYHSVPYHSFTNDDSYSSDESFKSNNGGVSGAGGGGGGLRMRPPSEDVRNKQAKY